MSEYLCMQCRGTIDPDEVKKCTECAYIYHDKCVIDTEAGWHCPNCGTVIKGEEEQPMSKRKKATISAVVGGVALVLLMIPSTRQVTIPLENILVLVVASSFFSVFYFVVGEGLVTVVLTRLKAWFG